MERKVVKKPTSPAAGVAAVLITFERNAALPVVMEQLLL